MYEIQGTHNLDGLKVQNCQKKCFVACSKGKCMQNK